eukprot:07966.XXX_165080_165274_1 [CDS] Oithona nana genome sequencing.
MRKQKGKEPNVEYSQSYGTLFQNSGCIGMSSLYLLNPMRRPFSKIRTDCETFVIFVVFKTETLF